MYFSENTVKAHINRMTDMLHAKNRVDAAVIAYRHGPI
jgi:DNA-binding CsgD family transcriptional regulator